MKTCKEVMEQIAYKEDLNLFENIGLRMHLLICKKCKKADQQISVMDKNLSLLIKQKLDKSESEVNRIKQKIKDRFST